MSETKAAFAERAKRAIKIIFQRYMEDYEYMYIHKLPQFFTTLNSRRNFSVDFKPNKVKNSEFLSVFIQGKLYKSTGNQNLKFELKIVSQSLICHSERAATRALRKIFLKLLQLLPKNHL